MILVEGEDLWREVGLSDLILITTNATVNRYGELTMGRGAALQCKQRYPWIAKDFGEQLISTGSVEKKYGLLFSFAKITSNGKQFRIGACQVKYHYKDNADLDLVRFSTEKLAELANKYPNKRIVLNFPAIGFGGRSEEEILPIISQLPDNCVIYKR